MVWNYLKVALRGIARQKLYALINIFGLATGIACAALVLLYVNDELTFDNFQENRNSIYSPVSRFYAESLGRELVILPGPAAAPVLAENIPEIVDFARFTVESAPVVCEGEAYRELLTFADASFFDVFSFPVAYGADNRLLEDPGAAVLTRARANALFGTENAVGMAFTAQFGATQYSFTVQAVAEDPPSNSGITFDILVPLVRLNDIYGPDCLNSWRYSGAKTYLLAGPGVDRDVLEPKVAAVMAEHIDPEYQPYEIVAFSRLHLDEACRTLATRVSNPTYSKVLGSIALAVLLIACVNFATLSMVRASDRSREIGIRQVVGAGRGPLAVQFWTEAIVMAVVALVLGVVLAELLLPTFNSLAAKDLSLGPGSGAGVWLGLLGLCLVTGLVAGGYPALYLSRLRPAAVFGNRLKIGGANFATRLLVILQFTLSVALLVSMWVMSEQLHYLRAADTGYADKMLLAISANTDDAQRLYELYRNEIIDHSSVLGMAATDAAFTGRHVTSMTFFEGDEEWRVNLYRIDYDFLTTVGVELVGGRNFSREHATDRDEAILVNEALAERVGWEDILGRQFRIGREQRPVSVIGVVKDFHYASMHYDIQPIMMHLGSEAPTLYFYVRISEDDIPATIAFLKDKWKRVAPNLPFDYHFADEQFDRMYSAEERWSGIVTYASILALITAALGMVGISAQTMRRRRREVCIRKVHGASVSTMLRMLCREYIILVSLAALAAWPISYLLMRRWLSGFAYHVNLNAWGFIASGLIVLAVALAAVAYQVMRTARVNPAETLRHE